MTQQEIDIKIIRLKSKKNELLIKVRDLDKEIQLFSIKQRNLDDPHALIPNLYKSVEEWLNDNRFPNTVISMIFKNRTEAEMAQISCNTYQEHYHVVKCPKEISDLRYQLKHE